jgi:hypothetical protein
MQQIHLTPEQWSQYSVVANELVFDHTRPVDMDRVSGAYLAVDDNDKPFAFVTYIEMDKETVYLQLGGVLWGRKGTAATYRQYEKFLNTMFEKYLVIKTKVVSSNTSYLMMALKAGFEIVGFEMSEQKLVLLEKRR